MKRKEDLSKGIQQRMFSELKEKKGFEQAVKYAYSYLDDALQRNVYPSPDALTNLKIFDEECPTIPADPHDILEILHTHGSPATVMQIGGRYFGLVNGGALPVTLASKWLTDCWDQNTPLYVTSPIVSKLEVVVEKWLKQLFNLPSETTAGFVSGSSMAIFCGLAAARYKILSHLGWDVNSKGLYGAPKVRVVLGKHAHATVIKALALLGLGKDNLEVVDVDDQGRIIPSQIPVLDDRTILILQAGNVHSGAFDAFNEICSKARKANAWVHVDGAFGLWAAASDNLKRLTKGMEDADSWSVDGHKTLNTPYDNGIILCRHKDALVSALHATGSYIIYGEERDGMLFTPEMSRRSRVVELWASIKYLGKSGIEELVDGLHQRAVQFGRELESHEFRVLNQICFNQVLVSCESEEITVRTMELVQKSGVCWCGGGLWDNRKVIRISICSWATTETDVSLSVKAFVEARRIAQKAGK